MTRSRTSVPHTARLAGLPPGLRATRATRAVLALFGARGEAALSPADVQAALERAGEPVNRVTVYRLLDRLVEAGLLERQVDTARVGRFALRPPTGAPAAPRFECQGCHRQFRLPGSTVGLQPALDAVLQALAAAGHQGLAVDLAVRGRCADCNGPAPVGTGDAP